MGRRVKQAIGQPPQADLQSDPPGSREATVHVPLPDRGYDIAIAWGALARTGEVARQTLGERARRLAVVSDRTVYRLYGERVEQSLREAGLEPVPCLIAPGERAKTLRTAERLWSLLLTQRFERREGILALGGGVVGDLAGFVAATYQRGIPFLQVPTTLLAQIDSSVGGKTGVNHPLGKNLIGAFHQPSAVLIDPAVLETLPQRELQAGLYEAVKYGIIWDSDLAQTIHTQIDLLRALDPVRLVSLIARCCQIKAEVVVADEHEGGLRRILNYGHTVGHALEAVTSYRRFRHGEAVGEGMKCAAAIARSLSLLSASDEQAIVTMVDAIGSRPRTDDLDLQAILDAMTHDKKRVAGRLPFILPTTIGQVVIRDDVPARVVRQVVKELIRGPGSRRSRATF
jgi:3-dehydroquinate synthase